MKDPYFERSVVCLCDYNEEGALGFIINKPLPISQGELLLQATEIEQLIETFDNLNQDNTQNTDSEDSLTDHQNIREQLTKAPQYQKNSLFGGPVQLNSGFLLIKTTLLPETQDSWKLQAHQDSSTNSEDGLTSDETTEFQYEIRPASQSISLLLLKGHSFELILGYSGWGKGQLEQEIELGSWLYCDSSDISLDTLLNLPVEERYDTVLAALGLSAGLIMMQPTEA
ncbi:MAG: hypothetical protein CMK59_15120 [Proteobacteria bacterium]|nr:hypothetical protein [Pseudomonadota bacterium]